VRLKRLSAKRSKRSLKQFEVYECLRSALLDGRFRPGSILSIRKIAAQLRTSTMPVRAAIARLVSEHALEMLSNHGVRVPILTRARAHEIYEARFALEGLAAANAASHMDPATLLELEEIQRRLERSARKSDIGETLTLNLQFHFALIRAARSETLVSLTNTLYLQWVPTLLVAMEGMQTARPEFIHTHHESILEGLRSRDARLARSALEKDLSDFKSDGFFVCTSDDQRGLPDSQTKRP